MKIKTRLLPLAIATVIVSLPLSAKQVHKNIHQKNHKFSHAKKHNHAVQLGPRPFYLVEDMDEGKLKESLKECRKGPFFKTDFSIGHRGAAMQFPEHTKESYVAAAKMGAGIIECDVTFTQDRELVL